MEPCIYGTTSSDFLTIGAIDSGAMGSYVLRFVSSLVIVSRLMVYVMRFAAEIPGTRTTAKYSQVLARRTQPTYGRYACALSLIHTICIAETINIPVCMAL